MVSCASSVTLCAQSSATETTASSEYRIAAIEKMLSSQQGMLHRLLSASEPRPSQAHTPEDNYEPPEDVYERARIEAGFSDQHKWNAAYIQGLICIDGERSKSITLDPPCAPCANTRNLAVCVSLAENDPYCGFLIYEKGVCCGWCEYQQIQSEEGERLHEIDQRTTPPLDGSEDQKRNQENPISIYIDGQEQESPLARRCKVFIGGEGLDREVITTEIPLYLGIDSLVRPGTHRVCLPCRK
jgi:hypothetical protein